MQGKIILIPAPVEMVKGWEGRVIYRKSGIYTIKKVIRTRVYYYAGTELPPADGDCFVTGLEGFYQPVVFIPQLSADSMYQELNYLYWKIAISHIAQATGALLPQNYKTHLVYVKAIKIDGVRIGARSPIQRCIRSGPRLTPALGW